ncbi:MAG: hypothetical protein ACRDS0_34990 [Pseudonocardiaceae bacterium]
MSSAGTTRTIMINFAGSASGLMNTTKQVSGMISKLGSAVTNIGSSLLSALGGNFKPLLKTVVGGIMAFAKVLFIIPSFLLALVNPMNVMKIAMTGFSQAISASSPQDFVAATRNMAPAMKAAVMSIRLLEPQLKNLYGIVEQGFWAGFSSDLSSLVAVYLPILDKSLGSMGTTLGGLRTKFMEFLASPTVVAAVTQWINAFTGLGAPILALVENSLPTMLTLFTSFANILVSLLPLVITIAGWFEKLLGWIAPLLSGISSIFGGLGGGATTGATTGAAGSGSGSSSSSSSSGGGLGGFFGGLISGIGGFFSSLFGGGRASGGPVFGGQSYLVGENGPEMLHMGGNGFVAPNGGGGHTFVNVKIGETELRGMISHEVAKVGQNVALASRMGRGLVI